MIIRLVPITQRMDDNFAITKIALDATVLRVSVTFLKIYVYNEQMCCSLKINFIINYNFKQRLTLIIHFTITTTTNTTTTINLRMTTYHY